MYNPCPGPSTTGLCETQTKNAQALQQVGMLQQQCSRQMATPFQLEQMQSTTCRKINHINSLSDESNRFTESTRREGLSSSIVLSSLILITGLWSQV